MSEDLPRSETISERLRKFRMKSPSASENVTQCRIVGYNTHNRGDIGHLRGSVWCQIHHRNTPFGQIWLTVGLVTCASERRKFSSSRKVEEDETSDVDQSICVLFGTRCNGRFCVMQPQERQLKISPLMRCLSVPRSSLAACTKWACISQMTRPPVSTSP